LSEIVTLKTQTQIDNEAALWTWRLDSGPLTTAEQDQFDVWLGEDNRHRHALEELRRTWSMLDRLAERPPEKLAALAGPQPQRIFVGRKRYWEAAAAAMLVVALGAALWITRRPGMQVMSTAVGQHRRVALADGSELTLNTDTLLAVELTQQRRDIYLRRGEAHFDVVHDAARPFYVHAGDTVIRDVGTQFEVRLHSDRDIDVLVDEGRVEVRGPVAADWVRALSAGEQLSIAGPRLKVMSVSPRQVANDLAWREGALVFDGEPLSQALVEVGRYTRMRIVLAGPKAASLPISGRFRTDDVQGFFRALQAALPVQVSQPQPGVVSIAAR
jgi:transmembrane sensor